jgi:TolB-like protein
MTEAPVKRRLAAILAGDMAGYSRLMGENEVGTLAALKALRSELVDPKIVAHEGRIFKSTGDGLLAEFPSVVNAVACAVDIQRGLEAHNTNLLHKEPIQLRIGVHAGDVIVEGDDVFGDGVNVAARLEAIAPPGGVVLSDTVRNHLGNRLNLRFEEVGEQFLKNIDRPVRVWRILLSDEAPMAIGSRPLVGQVTPSIAVLPFTNMSSDQEQEFFADGLSEDLITDLSKVPGLFVIARHSSFVYKGRNLDIRRAARELGVSYVVEGSVRRSASRVRISVQLIDAAWGGHVWADRFDRNLEDVFALQDEIVGKIVTALGDSLPSARLPPKRRAPKIDAYDLFVRGRVLTLQSMPTTRLGLPWLEKAIELDPDFAEAHAWLAANLTFQRVNGRQVGDWDRIVGAAERAVSLDPGNADGYWIRGYTLTYKGELQAGREQFELALKSNPNHADAWAFLADLEVYDGHPDGAIRAVEKAFQLNPHPHATFYWLKGFALYAARRYEEAVETLQHDSCRGTGSQRILAAALAQLERYSDAREVTRQFLITFPDFSLSDWARTQPFRHSRDLQHFKEGYIKAGLPE